MIVVSDTSPVSNLILINQLKLLRHFFSEIYIPPFVHSEIIAMNELGINIDTYLSSDWIIIKEPKNKTSIIELEADLDRGESEAIVLAKELGAELLLIDERLGTKKAKELGLKTIGLLGLLVQAKESGIFPSIKPLIEELEEKGFWISPKLKDRILKKVSE